MFQWLGYEPADLLIYAPRAYRALVQGYNQAVWPMHLFAAAVIVGMAVLLWRRERAGLRICMMLLSVCWLWVALAFFQQQYSTLHWAAGYMALAFVAQALWLLMMGFLPVSRETPWRSGLARVVGVVVFTAGIIAPLVVLLYQGMPWLQLEMPGLMPDPTAIITLGILVQVRSKMAVPALIIPLAWCLYSVVLHWAMVG